MKPKKTQATKTVTPNKKDKKAAKLIEANITAAAKETVQDRLLKYIYPTDCKTPREKKDYRRKMRALHDKYTKAIRKLGKSKEEGAQKELDTVTKEFASFTKKHYTTGSLA